MSETQNTTENAAKSKVPREISAFAVEFLSEDAVAIIIKQKLLPDDVENPVIFPPTYLRAKDNVQDENGENDEKKGTKKGQQKTVYNLDPLGEGKNVCEIDGAQSDGNRTESLFKLEPLRNLVPQIEISVGDTTKSILDAGHRAADALVRFSSLAAEFHHAFERTRISPPDHSMLAVFAPTSLLYGVYDSRSTQSKLQRIIKASIRAENVKPLHKSATFIPAVNYVGVNAIKEDLDVGEGDSNPLSSEGMKYALASQTLGGVRLSDAKTLFRTIKINLAALRELNAIVELPKLKKDATEEDKAEHQAELSKQISGAAKKSKDRTDALRKYILGLALSVAKATPNLNLREGCNLRLAGQDEWVLVKHRAEDEKISVGDVSEFAETSAKAFFGAMNIEFEKKDHPNVTFDKGVAEEFLGLTDAKGNLSSAERDKVRALGAVTKDTLAIYWAARRKKDKAGDPVEVLRNLVQALDFKGKDEQKKFKPAKKLNQKLEELIADASTTQIERDLASKIKMLFTDEIGADERKQQMLSLFPVVAEPTEGSPAEAPVATDKGAAQ